MRLQVDYAEQVIPGGLLVRGAKGRKRGDRRPLWRWTPYTSEIVLRDGQVGSYRSAADYPAARTDPALTYTRPDAERGPALAVRGKWSGSAAWSTKMDVPVITLRRTMARRIKCVIISDDRGWIWTVTRTGRGPDAEESGRERTLARAMRQSWAVALGLVAGVCAMEGVRSPKRLREGRQAPTPKDLRRPRK